MTEQPDSCVIMKVR